MTLIFDLLFRDFFGLGESFCFLSLLDVVLVDPRFVAFPRIHRFHLRFSSQRNTLSAATFAQE